MKEIFKSTFKHILIFISVILLFVILLIISSSFDSKYIKDNVVTSSETLLSQRNSYEMKLRNRTIKFDNYSDALMLNTAYSIDSSTPLYSAFTAKKNYIPGTNKIIYNDVSEELCSDVIFDTELSQVEELYELVHTTRLTESFEYTRYWHGYLSFLRPALVIMDITEIRILLTIILVILFIIFSCLIYKRLGLIYAIIFFLVLCCTEYFYIGISLQGCSIFIITMITMIIILMKKDITKHMTYIFMITGMLTNYLDFLTNPAITFAFPVITYFLLKQKENNFKSKKIIKDFLIFGIFWVIGYGLTWLFKWILIDIIYDRTTLSQAVFQAIYRSGGEAKKVWRLLMVLPCWFYYKECLYLTIIIFIGALFYFRIVKSKKVFKKIFIKENIPYILTMIIPFAWENVLLNHTWLHMFFTYRVFSIFHLSLMIMVVNIIKKLKE